MRLHRVGVMLFFSGCYLEVGGAYYPRVQQQATRGEEHITDTSAAWGASFKLGFYLDIPVPFAQTRMGVGVSAPVASATAVVQKEAPSLTPQSRDIRFDIGVPKTPWRLAGLFAPRLTAGWGAVREFQSNVATGDRYYYPGKGEASGRNYFVGSTLWYSTALAGIGLGLLYEHVDASTKPIFVDREKTFQSNLRADGLAARLIIRFIPGAPRFFRAEYGLPQQRGNAGCYYTSAASNRYKCQ